MTSPNRASPARAREPSCERFQPLHFIIRDYTHEAFFPKVIGMTTFAEQSTFSWVFDESASIMQSDERLTTADGFSSDDIKGNSAD